MNVSARRSLVGAFVLLSVIGLLRSCDEAREMEATTLGTTPWGYGAFFELVGRVWPETRRVRGTDVAPPEVVWWIRQWALCERRPSAAVEWPLRSWVERGGIAIVALSENVDARCALGRDIVVPARRPLADSGATIEGPGLVARPRALPGLTPAVFEEPGGAWRVRGRANDEPFVIERRLGAGTLVVVADGVFLTNAHLADGDAAPLALELSGAWGPPVFDDGTITHAAGGPVRYLVRSPGAVPLVAVALLGLALVWSGSLVPARRDEPDVRPAPRLDDFVRSLGRLHRESRDWVGLLSRQQGWAIAALAPHLGLPSHAAAERVLARLRVARDPGSAAPLEPGSPVEDREELERRFAAIAALVEDVAT
jgi:hypothetical protein